MQPQRTLDRGRPVGAGEHELADGETAERLQVVEVVMKAERARLRAKHAAGALPTQRLGAGHFRHEFVAQRAQPGDPRGVRHTGVVREGGVYPPRGELGGQR